MPQADLSVWVGVIAPALPVLGLCQREGTPLGRVSDAACRKRAAYSRSAWSSEAPIPLPGNSPAMVSAAVAAIPCLPLPAVDLGTPPPSPGDVAEPARRPSASPHDRRTCNRPETGTRLSLSPSRSPLPSNWLFEVSRRGSESRSLALVPAARKAPASFSCRRARFWRRQRARSVTFCLWTAARIDARVCRGSGLNLRDVFPTGCVAGRAEGAARSPDRGLRRGAELDRPRPQPVVDGVECLDQLVVPWILRIE